MASRKFERFASRVVDLGQISFSDSTVDVQITTSDYGYPKAVIPFWNTYTSANSGGCVFTVNKSSSGGFLIHIRNAFGMSGTEGLGVLLIY